jgi:hypothetical protein
MVQAHPGHVADRDRAFDAASVERKSGPLLDHSASAGLGEAHLPAVVGCEVDDARVLSAQLVVLGEVWLVHSPPLQMPGSFTSSPYDTDSPSATRLWLGLLNVWLSHDPSDDFILTTRSADSHNGIASFRRLSAGQSFTDMPDESAAAAAEEIQRRREEIGFSYFVFGADFADTLAPVVANLAGH